MKRIRKSSDENSSLSAAPVSERNSKFIDIGSTVKISSNSEKLNSPSETSKTPTVAAQRLVSLQLLLETYTYAGSIWCRSYFPLPLPPFTKTPARNLKNRANIESKLTLLSVINKPSLLCKIKLIYHLLPQNDLIWKLLLIIILKHFHCYIQNYHPVFFYLFCWYFELWIQKFIDFYLNLLSPTCNSFVQIEIQTDTDIVFSKYKIIMKFDRCIIAPTRTT